MEINQFNIQNPTDSHTWQKINIGGEQGEGGYVSDAVFQVSRGWLHPKQSTTETQYKHMYT